MQRMNTALLQSLRNDAIRFLKSRQTSGKPFGHFSQCAHAFASDELSALTVALELWKMLGIPLPDSDLTYVHKRIQSMQHPDTGLLIDPAWHGRLSDEGAYMPTTGDSFFTRSAVCALEAWDLHLKRPVAYLQQLTPNEWLPCILWGRGGHDPFALGDLAVLLKHNRSLGVSGAAELHDSFLEAVAAKQDPATGLWINGDPADALFPGAGENRSAGGVRRPPTSSRASRTRGGRRPWPPPAPRRTDHRLLPRRLPGRPILQLGHRLRL